MENTNKKRYWLRGGAFGVIFVVLYFLAGLLSPAFGEVLTDILGVMFRPAFSLLKIFGFPSQLELGNIIFSLLFSSVLYGVIIGFIYGKIKNRKSVVSQSNA